MLGGLIYPVIQVGPLVAGVATEVNVQCNVWYRLWPGTESDSCFCFMVTSADDAWNTTVLKKIGKSWVESMSPFLTISVVSKSKVSLTVTNAYSPVFKIQRMTF